MNMEGPNGAGNSPLDGQTKHDDEEGGVAKIHGHIHDDTNGHADDQPSRSKDVEGTADPAKSPQNILAAESLMEDTFCVHCSSRSDRLVRRSLGGTQILRFFFWDTARSKAFVKSFPIFKHSCCEYNRCDAGIGEHSSIFGFNTQLRNKSCEHVCMRAQKVWLYQERAVPQRKKPLNQVSSCFPLLCGVVDVVGLCELVELACEC